MLKKIKDNPKTKENSHKRFHLKKNDKVKVLAGKDKGKIGKILKIVQKKDRAIVENLNMIKRHMRKTQQNRQGGIVEKEAPIHWSNLILICTKCVKPTRIKMHFLEDGKKVRVCKKCNEIIDI